MPLLYELSSNPSEALEQVLDHYSRPFKNSDPGSLEERLFADAMPLLTEDAYVAPGVTENIAGLYHFVADTRPEVSGPLGLYVALASAQAATLAGDQAGRTKAEVKAAEPLEDTDVQRWFRAFYGLDDAYLLDDSKLHRVGTTSLILRATLQPEGRFNPPLDVALKCLLPRYHGVVAIRAATKRYAEEGAVAGAPRLHDVSSLRVAMDFIEGETLEERLDKRARESESRELDEEDIEFIRDLGLAICASLDKLERDDHHHLDLSPSNIIIVDETAKPMTIQLIDFGHNFLITERVGSSAAFRRAELYVAPELIENPSLDDWRADAYSLGVILLGTAAKRQLTKENVGHEMDRLWQGDLHWQGAPTLARVIEELIDSDPEQRLILMDQDSTDTPYGYLSKLIVQETEVMSIYEGRTESSGFGILRGRGLVKVYSNAQVMNLLDIGKQIKNPVDDSYEDFPALAQWAVISILCWIVVLGSFIAFTFADLDPKAATPLISQFTEATGARFDIGDFWANLPGRLVALTFSLTAVTYYVNNFSMLSPKRIDRRIGLASQVAMRGTAVFLVFPTMWAIVHDPSAWPICAGIGTSLVVVNNYLALCVAKRAFQVGRRFSTRNAAGDRFITEVFKEWWRLMGAYSLAMIVIGILLVAGVAHDEAIFAVIVVAINVAKMYRLNCVELAPQVRGCLSRDILTLRRADRLPRPLAQDVGSQRWAIAVRIYRWWWTPVRGSQAHSGAAREIAQEGIGSPG